MARRPLWLPVVFAILALTGAERAAAETVRVHLAHPPKPASAAANRLSINETATRAVYDALVHFNAEARTTPGLAESWELGENGVWRFQLRPGVQFHDGGYLDADDVVASIRQRSGLGSGSGPEPATPEQKDRAQWRPRAYDDLIVAVKRGPLDVEIRTKMPQPDLLRVLAQLPIVSSDGDKTAGSGPYMADADAGPAETSGDGSVANGVRLVRFDGHWAGRAPFEGLSLVGGGNGAERLRVLAAGDADLVQAPPGGLPQRLAGAGLGYQEAPTDRLVFLWLNARDAAREKASPFAKPNIRDATLAAINRAGLLEWALRNDAETLDPLTAGPMAFNPEGALALLKEAGRQDGFAFRIAPAADRPAAHRRVAQALGQMLRRIGLKEADGGTVTPGAALITLGVASLSIEPRDALLTRLVAAEATPSKKQEPAALRAALAKASETGAARFLPLYIERQAWAYRAGLDLEPAKDGGLNLRSLAPAD